MLGAGGFGITYLAFNHQLNGPVALKEYFPAELATRVDGERVAATAPTNQETFAWGLERFLDEARAIHRFRHPNVVQAHRYLEANGTAYIVMEYVEGESLKSILDRRGRLSAEEWRPWMDALLDGMEHVHSHNYLHRDVKPANIVVRAATGEPVLVDFGSARAQQRDRTHTQVLTAGYAPIEQYSGGGGGQGPPSDIYALAALSHRVLTGNAVPRGAAMPVYRTPDGRIVEETTLVTSSGNAPDRHADDATSSPGTTDAAREHGGAGYDNPTVIRRPGAAPGAPPGEERTRLAGAVPATPGGEEVDPVAGWLVVVEGPGTGRDLRIGVGRSDLGRSGDNRIALPFGDTRISRRCHLWVNYDPRHHMFSVAPGRGTNLAYLGETAIEERMPLADGATIAVGKTRLRFVAFCGTDFDWPDE